MLSKHEKFTHFSNKLSFLKQSRLAIISIANDLKLKTATIETLTRTRSFLIGLKVN